MTLLYLWLAARGSGGLAAFFRHPARTGVAVASVLMACAAFCSDANLNSGEREDRSNSWIFLPLLTIGLPEQAPVPAYTERKGWGILERGDRSLARPLSFTSVVAHCGLRQSLSSAVVSADWWRSSPDISSSPMEFTALSVTRVIWD